MQDNSRISLITLAIAASPVCLPHYAPRVKGTLTPWRKGDGGRLKLGRDGDRREGGVSGLKRDVSIYDVSYISLYRVSPGGAERSNQSANALPAASRGEGSHRSRSVSCLYRSSGESR